MEAPHSRYATELIKQQDRHISIVPVLESRRPHAGIWVFDSPKINKRFTVTGDRRFMHIVLAEGSPDIKDYDPRQLDRLIVLPEQQKALKGCLSVGFTDGHTEWWSFETRIDEDGTELPIEKETRTRLDEVLRSKNEFRHSVKTDSELRRRQIFFENWLFLCASITRCRLHSKLREQNALKQQLNSEGSCTLKSLLAIPGIDPALMIATVGLLLQAGLLDTNLETRPFSLTSQFCWRKP